MNWINDTSDLPGGVNPFDVLFAWQVDESLRQNKLEDIAEAYVVESCEKADSGVIIWAKYHGKWESNPFTTRALVKKLISLIPQATNQPATKGAM